MIKDFVEYRKGGRGTGKTTRLIKALPDGGIYITQSGMQSVVDQYLKQIGRNDANIKVLSVRQLDQLRGKQPRPVAIDHFVIEDRLIADSDWRLITRAPMILRCDEEGDVIVTYCPEYA